MRKIVIGLGLVAFAATPFVATATVVPTAMNTMLLQDTSDVSPASIPVKHKGEFIPFAVTGLAALAGGIAFAAQSGNSPS